MLMMLKSQLMTLDCRVLLRTLRITPTFRRRCPRSASRAHQTPSPTSRSVCPSLRLSACMCCFPQMSVVMGRYIEIFDISPRRYCLGTDRQSRPRPICMVVRMLLCVRATWHPVTPGDRILSNRDSQFYVAAATPVFGHSFDPAIEFHFAYAF